MQDGAEAATAAAQACVGTVWPDSCFYPQQLMLARLWANEGYEVVGSNRRLLVALSINRGISVLGPRCFDSKPSIWNQERMLL